nr:MAG TPA: Protein of unknown function (DUF669) [Caudoviricetes sp.]
MTSIKITGITDEALSSTTTSTPVPAGSYNATVFEVKLEEVRSGPNEGKPRFNVQFRISSGSQENRRVFSYIPLYVAKDFWKSQSFFSALGYDIKSGEFKVPEINDLLGKPIGVRVKVGKDQNGDDRSEVSGFDKPTTSKAEAALSSIGAVPAESVWVE